MSDEDARIREAAYHLWESEGRPTGQDRRHWELARQMVRAGEPSANIPRADELPPQGRPGAVPEEKPKRRARAKTGQTGTAKAAGSRKTAATSATRSRK